MTSMALSGSVPPGKAGHGQARRGPVWLGKNPRKPAPAAAESAPEQHQEGAGWTL